MGFWKQITSGNDPRATKRRQRKSRPGLETMEARTMLSVATFRLVDGDLFEKQGRHQSLVATDVVSMQVVDRRTITFVEQNGDVFEKTAKGPVELIQSGNPAPVPNPTPNPTPDPSPNRSPNPNPNPSPNPNPNPNPTPNPSPNPNPTPNPNPNPNPNPTPDPTPPTPAPAGFSPAQIKVAYSENFDFNVNGQRYEANGAGETIAIVEAGYDPEISQDLAAFDQEFGLPAPPNFSYFIAPGAASYFSGAGASLASNWYTETALDVEWAHAIAPGANILLEGAASQSPSDLAAAVSWVADQPGVSVVSMSWGIPEQEVGTQYDSAFMTPAGHTGVTFVASAGDSGYFNSHAGDQIGVQWPAADPDVLSVGGTSLYTAANGNYLGETAWNLTNEGSNGWWGGGGGLSQVYAEPSYQYGVQNTGVRTVPDVSYDANVNTGFAVYDAQSGGWTEVGGTSAGAPQWAALIAIADQGRALANMLPLDGPSQTLPALYQFSSDFNQVTTGSNGYSAGPGYNLATGLGTPIAITLVGDLAFHVNSEYEPSSADVMMAAATHSMLSGNESALASAQNAAVGGSSLQGAPTIETAVPETGPAASTDQSVLIALTPALWTNPSQSNADRPDHFDLALESLADDDLEILRS